jgi:hypothetical protein
MIKLHATIKDGRHERINYNNQVVIFSSLHVQFDTISSRHFLYVYKTKRKKWAGRHCAVKFSFHIMDGALSRVGLLVVGVKMV